MSRGRRTGGHQWVDYLRTLLNYSRRGTDPEGVLRHDAGGIRQGTFDYWPESPSLGLKDLIAKMYTFHDRIDILSDAIDATTYRWNETASGAGTPLAVIDAPGGIGQFTNGAGDNNFYTYETDAEFMRPITARHIWFEAIVRISDAIQSDFFMGVCQRIGAGNLFDNRVNCIGFRSQDGDANLDLVSTAASAETETAAQDTLEDDTWITLGFHYNGTLIEFYTDDVFRAAHTTNIPATEMCVSFGLRNGEAVAKVMSLARITVGTGIVDS